MDSPFCSWTVRSAEKSHFGENFCSPTDDFGGSKMRGYYLGRIFGGLFPSSPWASVSLHLIGGFLLQDCERSPE